MGYGMNRILHGSSSIFNWIMTQLACFTDLKVPKCENFHRTDFFDFFTIKPLWVGDFRAKIKNSKF